MLESVASILLWLVVIVIILVVLFFLLDHFLFMIGGIGVGYSTIEDMATASVVYLTPLLAV